MVRQATQSEYDNYFRTVLTPDCPSCGANPCYRFCPLHPEFYSAEQEYQDSMWQESLSDAMFRSLAYAQQEADEDTFYDEFGPEDESWRDDLPPRFGGGS